MIMDLDILGAIMKHNILSNIDGRLNIIMHKYETLLPKTKFS